MIINNLTPKGKAKQLIKDFQDLNTGDNYPQEGRASALECANQILKHSQLKDFDYWEAVIKEIKDYKL